MADIARTPPTDMSGLDPATRRRLLQRLRRHRNSGLWFVPSRGLPTEPDIDLFCFPYAGAGASIYHQWQHAAGGDRRFRVIPVQPPGRENRLDEQPYRRMTDLVDDFIYALSPMLGKPFAFFGHSMGALTAYEVACALRDRGMPQPSRLLLSAFRAPHLPSANIKIYHLPDEVLRIVLAKDGISPDILASDELMQAILPTLRADLELCDTYEHEVRKPLDVPISAYGGEQDIRVRPEDLVGWRDHTTSSFELTTFPGDHFYLQPAVNELVGDVRQRLSSSFHTEASIHGGDVA